MAELFDERPLFTTAVTKRTPSSDSDIVTVPKSNDYSEMKDFFENWITYNGVKITAPLIYNILQGGFTGNAQAQAAFFQTIMEKEPVITAHMETRRQALLAVGWSLVGGTESKRDDMTEILEKAGLDLLIAHLDSALGLGYSGAGIKWGKGGGTIKTFNLVDPTNWGFEKDGRVYLMSKSQGNVYVEDNFNYVFHSHLLKPGISSTGGLLRPLVFNYFFKNYAMRHHARFLERYGIPFLIAKISDQDFGDPATRARIKTQLRNLGADGVGVVTKDTEVNPVTPPSQSNNADFQRWIDYHDKVFTLLILGQLATSSEGSGLNTGQPQENVRNDLLAGDAEGMMKTLNRMVVDPLEHYKYGTNDVKLVMEYEEAEDLKEVLERVDTLDKMGWETDEDWLEEQVKIPITRKKKGTGSASEEVIPPAEGELPIGLPPPEEVPAPAEGALPENPLELLTDSSGKKKIHIEAFGDIDLEALDQAVDAVIAGSALPQELKSRLIAGKPKDLVGIFESINNGTFLAQLDEEQSDEVRAELARVRSAVKGIDAEQFRVPDEAEEIQPEEVGELVEEIHEPEPAPLLAKAPPPEAPMVIPEEEPEPEVTRDEPVVTPEEIEIARKVAKDPTETNRLNADLGEALELSMFGKAKDEPADKYFERAWGKVNPFLQKIINKQKLLDAFTRERELALYKADQTYDLNLDALKPQYTDSTIKNLWVDTANILPKTWQAAQEGTLSGAVNIMTLGNALGLDSAFGGDRKENLEWLRNVRQYTGEEQLANPLESDTLLGDALYGVARMAPLWLAAFTPVPGAATAVFMADGAGEMLNAMDEAGVDREISLPLSLVGGYIYAKIENLQLRGAFPGTGRAGLEAVKKGLSRQLLTVTTKLIKKHGSKKMAQLFTRFAKNKGVKFATAAIKEVGEEGAQEIVKTYTDILGRGTQDAIDKLQSESDRNLVGQTPGLIEQGKRAGIAMKESIAPLMLMMLTGRGTAPIQAKLKEFSNRRIYNSQLSKELKLFGASDIEIKNIIRRINAEDNMIPAGQVITEEMGIDPNALRRQVEQGLTVKTVEDVTERPAMEVVEEPATEDLVQKIDRLQNRLEEASREDDTERTESIREELLDAQSQLKELMGIEEEAPAEAVEAPVEVPSEAILVKASPRSGSILVGFDKSAPVPTAEEIKKKFTDKGIDVDVIPQRGFFSGIRDIAPFKIDVFLKDGRVAGNESTIDAYRAVIGDKTISAATKAEAELPLEARFDFVRKKVGEGLGLAPKEVTERPALEEAEEEAVAPPVTEEDVADVIPAVEREAIEEPLPQTYEDFLNRVTREGDVEKMKQALAAHLSLPKVQQIQAYKNALRESIKELSEPSPTAEELIGAELTPEKVTMTTRQYLTEKFKTKARGERAGKRGLMLENEEANRILNDYMREVELPKVLSDSFKIKFKEIATTMDKGIKMVKLADMLDVVDSALDIYKQKVAIDKLRTRMKKLKDQFGVGTRRVKLDPRLQAVFSRNFDDISMATAKEGKIRDVLESTKNFIENPQGTREDFLRELGIDSDGLIEMGKKPTTGEGHLIDVEKISTPKLKMEVVNQRRGNMPQKVLDRLNQLDVDTIGKLTTDEIRLLDKRIEMIMNYQRAMNQERKIATAIENQENINEAGESIDQPETGLRLTKIPIVKQMLNLYRAAFLPESYLAWYADGGREGAFFKVLVESFWDGDNRRYKVMQDVDEQLEEFSNKTGIDTNGWEKKTDVYELDSGEAIQISPNERMSIYLHSLNEDNRKHLLEGGLVLDEKNLESPIRLTQEDLVTIIGDMNDSERLLANKISEVFDNTLRNYINEISLALNGYEIADIDKYFPIVTSSMWSKYYNPLRGDVLPTNRPMSDFAIEALGMLHARTDSSSPIVLQDALKALGNSTNLAGMYYGYAKPLRMAKAFARGKYINKDGKPVALGNSVIKKYGRPVWKALTNLSRDIERGNRDRDVIERFINGMLNRLTKGTLSFNPKVGTMQISSYSGAANEMPAKHWAKGLITNPLNLPTYEFMGKFSPFMWSRGKGTMSMAIGEAKQAGKSEVPFVGDTLRSVDNYLQSLGEKGFGMISYMDWQAIGRIWKGSESWVAEDIQKANELLSKRIETQERILGVLNPATQQKAIQSVQSKIAELEEARSKVPKPKSKEFYNEVARRTEKVTRLTQPTFETTDRPAAARLRWIGPLFMRYTSQLVKDYGQNFKMLQDLHNVKDPKDAGKMVARMGINWLLKPAIIGGISMLGMAARRAAWAELYGALGLRPPEDDEDDEVSMMNLIKHMGTASLAQNGQVLGAVARYLQGFQAQDPVLSAMLNRNVKLIRDMGQLLSDVHNEEPNWKKRIPKIIRGILIAGSTAGYGTRGIGESLGMLWALSATIGRKLGWLEPINEKIIREELEGVGKSQEEINEIIKIINESKKDVEKMLKEQKEKTDLKASDASAIALAVQMGIKAFADNPVLLKRGAHLFDTQDSFEESKRKLEGEKTSIQPALTEPLEVPGRGTIFNVDPSRSMVLNRGKLKALLMKTLGVSPEVADKIIDSSATEKIIKSYVKVVRKKAIAKQTAALKKAKGV